MINLSFTMRNRCGLCSSRTDPTSQHRVQKMHRSQFANNRHVGYLAQQRSDTGPAISVNIPFTQEQGTIFLSINAT